MVIRKYSNRRLYDTDESRYVTVDEVAHKIRRGEDLRVVDVSSGTDLTQQTLTQIIMEGRGAAKLLPVPLLYELVRMEDDALADFFGRYTTLALRMYKQVQQGTNAIAPFNPLTQMPQSAAELLSRLMGAAGIWGPGWGAQTPPPRAYPEPPPPPPPPADPEPSSTELAEVKRELAEIKAVLANAAFAAKSLDWPWECA